MAAQAPKVGDCFPQQHAPIALPTAVMADNGMLAAREPTPEPAAHSKRSPSPGAGAASAAAADSAPAASPRGAQQSTLLGAGASGPLGKVDGGEGSEYRVSDSMDAELAPAGGDEEYDPETAFAEDDAKPAAAAAPALDWAAIKAAAASATAEERQSGMQLLGSLDSLHAGSKQEGAEGKHEHKLKHHHHRREHASPLELPSPREVRRAQHVSAEVTSPPFLWRGGLCYATGACLT